MSSTVIDLTGRETRVRISRLRERAFFSAMTITMALVVFVGFAPSYFLRSHAMPALPLLLEIHGFIFTTWMVLQVVQTALIGVHRVNLHYRLGYARAVLAALVFVSGAALVIVIWKRAFNGLSRIAPYAFPDAPFSALAHQPVSQVARAFPDSVLALAGMSLVAFAILVGCAIWLRSRPGIHKRLILIATTELLSPPIGRFAGGLGLGGDFLLADLFIVAIATYDRLARGSLHPVTARVGLIVVISQPLRLLVTQTTLSHSVMAWIAHF
jgi:hypothetical protein